MNAQDIYELFSSTTTRFPTSSNVRDCSYRLDARVHSSDHGTTEALLNSSSFNTVPLGELAEVHCSGIRERVFVKRGNGIVLLTGSTLDATSDDDLKYVSRLLTRNYDLEKLDKGDILITSAGTVGKVVFVCFNHEGRLASQDIIRIRPNKGGPPSGYLFAYLSSLVVQRHLLLQPAGSVIVRIYEADLERLSIPRFSPEFEQRVSDTVFAASDARATARQIIVEADGLFHEINNLETLTEESTHKDGCSNSPQETVVDSRMVRKVISGFLEYRLDAHFYNPTAQRAVDIIKNCPSEVRTLGEVVRGVLLGSRFKRNYVESAYGVPFLSGKNIVQIRPTNLKYISNLQVEDMEEIIINDGLTLITRSGTVGRTCFIWKNYSGYAASEHILRVIPDEANIDPGYLYAFLNSPYGYEQVLRHRHGSVIDEVTDTQVKHVLVPYPSRKDQKKLGDMVRMAYEKLAEAIRLEDEAQEILIDELAGPKKMKGA